VLVSPSPPSVFPVTTVRLEPFTDLHLDDVTLLLADPDVERFTRIPVPQPPRLPTDP
jgi:hypothetical protein